MKIRLNNWKAGQPVLTNIEEQNEVEVEYKVIRVMGSQYLIYYIDTINFDRSLVPQFINWMVSKKIVVLRIEDEDAYKNLVSEVSHLLH